MLLENKDNTISRTLLQSSPRRTHPLYWYRRRMIWSLVMDLPRSRSNGLISAGLDAFEICIIIAPVLALSQSASVRPQYLNPLGEFDLVQYQCSVACSQKS